MCETNVESYAVNADEFYLLFNHDNEIDQLTFDEMRKQEVRRSFQMCCCFLHVAHTHTCMLLSHLGALSVHTCTNFVLKYFFNPFFCFALL